MSFIEENFTSGDNVTFDVNSKVPFDGIKIKDGEEPTPSTFARPILGLMDSDSRLDQAIQYLNRSTSIMATDKTTFIAHFDKGFDTEITKLNYTVVGQSTDCISNIGKYKGAFSSCNAGPNLLEQAGRTDSSMKSEIGWTYSGNNDARCSFQYSSNGMRINNKLRCGSRKACELTVFPLKKVPLVTTMQILYTLFKVRTDADIKLSNVDVMLRLDFFNGGTLVSSILGDKVPEEFSGIVRGSYTIPAGADSVLPVFVVKFNGESLYIDANIWDLMITADKRASDYCTGSNSGTGVIYHDALTRDTYTLFSRVSLFWDNDKEFPSKRNIITLTGDTDKELSIQESGKLLKLVLYDKTTKLVVLESEPIKIIEKFSDKESPQEFFSCGVRKSPELGTQMFAVFPNRPVQVVSIDLAEYDVVFSNIALGAYREDISNLFGHLTELRHDNEWLNDQQLMVASISDLPFYSKEISSLTTENIYDILDSISVNILKNPDGRLNQYHWSGFPDTTIFSNAVSVPKIGSGWKWTGGRADKRYVILSEDYKINSSQDVRFRAKVMASPSGVGKYGIGFLFKDGLGGNVVPGDGSVNGEFLVYGKHGRELEYIGVRAFPPDGATHVQAFMVIENDLTSDLVYWSKLKLEQGEVFSMFTDDSSPKHALYAP